MSRPPYRYLDYYRLEDADLFFGRESEVQKMVGEILSTRLLVLFSPSGSGKTSLINAGVRPRLIDLGYRTVYSRFDPSVGAAVARDLNLPEPGEEDSLYEFLKLASKAAQRPLVLFLDQFEEFFVVLRDEQEKRKRFIEELARIRYDEGLPVFVVLSLREDYFANLHEFRESIPSIFQYHANIRLEPFNRSEARLAIEEPLKVVGGGFEEGLVARLIGDLEDGKDGVEPITLQIVCYTLWQKRPGDSTLITAALYESCGGARRILESHVRDLLRAVPRRRHASMARIFEALKTPDNTKRFLTFNELQKGLGLRAARLKGMLEGLTGSQLLRHELRFGEDWFEFKHDYLVERISEWLEERRQKLQQRRLVYSITPGIVLFLGLLGYFIFQYHTFYAGFTNPAYEAQEQEIVVSRGFDPFHDSITTGYLHKDTRDLKAQNALRKGLKLGMTGFADWKPLASGLNIVEGGLLLYKSGDREGGLRVLLNALVDAHAASALIDLARSDEAVTGALVDRLKDQDRYVRSRAASALGSLGKAGGPRVIGALIDGLKDEDSYVRSRAASALGNLGSADGRVVGALLNGLKDIHYVVRAEAASALGNLGKGDQAVIDGLMDGLKDQDSYVRSRAASALAGLGQGGPAVVGALLEAVKDQDRYVASEAVSALGTLGKGDQAVIGVFIDALKVQDSDLRARAASALGELGMGDPSVIDVLIEALNDQDSDVRARAAAGLGRLGMGVGRVLDALVNGMKDQDSDVRSHASSALVSLGKGDVAVVGLLVDLLKDQNGNVRSEAAAALGNLGKGDPGVMAGLIDRLQDRDSYVRSQAAAALGNLGKGDLRTIDALINRLEDQDGDVRSAALSALGNLGKSDLRVINLLIDLLKHYDGFMRSRAVTALENLGESDGQVIRALIETLMDRDSFVRSRAASALGNLGKGDPAVIDALVDTLSDQDSNVRSRAASALGDLGKGDPAVIDALVGALKDQNVNVRSRAAACLGDLLQSKSDEELFTWLNHRSSGYRIAGLQALARRETVSEGMESRISGLKADKHPWVRLAAWEADRLIRQRKESERRVEGELALADSLFADREFARAGARYQSVFEQLSEMARFEGEKSASVKYRQARCEAGLHRFVTALASLEIAFRYAPALRERFRAEMSEGRQDWAILQGNWYVREVILKGRQ